MTIDALREAREGRPFKPFTLHLADSRSVRIPHPDFLYMPPKNPRTIVISTVSGGIRLIDLLMVVEIEFEDSRRGRKAG
ncbi:MAG: hypothetical protein WD749_05390 [Phycisphaerales bacterium]